jgi:crossover junction endodeoxyribonuclease RuvC
MIEGVAAGMRIPYSLVIPQTWKKALGVPADKNAARARACQLFPNMASKFARVKDDGRAEAALIALFGYRDLVGMLA